MARGVAHIAREWTKPPAIMADLERAREIAPDALSFYRMTDRTVLRDIAVLRAIWQTAAAVRAAAGGGV
jgi:hypothetical protein